MSQLHQILPVKSEGENFFEVEANLNFLFAINIPNRTNIDIPIMREIKLSDQATKILRKLTSSEFDINLIKSLCSDLKVNLRGGWGYSKKKRLFNKKNELGFLIIENDYRLFSNDALSDDILSALIKYRAIEQEQKKFDVYQNVNLTIIPKNHNPTQKFFIC